MMSYCSVLSFATKLTKIEDVLCLGTMRGRGHSIIKWKLSENCQSVDLLSMPQDAFRFVGQLAPQQGWFGDDGVRLKLYGQKLKNGVIVKSNAQNDSHSVLCTSFF